MASNFTPVINDLNVQNVQRQIAIKKGCSPYLATVNQASQVVTDYDTFPYPRYFRGVPESTVPIVAEREAVWRPRHDSCYKVLEPPGQIRYPNHCYETACSTTLPCYPNQLNRYADREALNVMLNDACIAQYR